ncbi:MAG: hypothetical protein OEW82_08830 [Dehalococcoidia bacterium]|nr:hypothetical protein [Dehalococcoidia bacterium]
MMEARFGVTICNRLGNGSAAQARSINTAAGGKHGKDRKNKGN